MTATTSPTAHNTKGTLLSADGTLLHGTLRTGTLLHGTLRAPRGTLRNGTLISTRGTL